MQDRKIYLTERALLARIRRALARDSRNVRKKRGPNAEALPAWVIIDENGSIVDGFDDPEAFARAHGLIEPFETLLRDGK